MALIMMQPPLSQLPAAFDGPNIDSSRRTSSRECQPKTHEREDHQSPSGARERMEYLFRECFEQHPSSQELRETTRHANASEQNNDGGIAHPSAYLDPSRSAQAETETIRSDLSADCLEYRSNRS